MDELLIVGGILIVTLAAGAGIGIYVYKRWFSNEY